ncbi:MAG: signal transduction histidine kinase [Ignavibacteria bacterium]|nr:signal transduction histidine kinase [Ignavibacteria bacterium]
MKRTDSDIQSHIALQEELFENSPYSYFILNSIQELIYHNSAAKALLDKYLINPDITNDEKVVFIKTQFADSITSAFKGLPFQKEVEIVYNGQNLFFETTCYCYKNANGTIAGVILILNDITFRKKNEEEHDITMNHFKDDIDELTKRLILEDGFRESEERYQAFVRNFRGITFRRTHDFQPIFYHGSVEKITGYKEEEFLKGSVKWEDIVHPHDVYNVKKATEFVCLAPGTEQEVEYRILNKERQIQWIHEYMQSVEDASGAMIYVQGTIYNVTEQKKAEEALTKSREQLRNFAIYVEQAREEERKRIAFEVHDELGHLLTAMKLDLSWLMNKRYLKQEVLNRKLNEMSNHVDTIIRKVRTISSQLRPSVLDHFGLVAAIEWQASEFQKRSAVRCRFTVSRHDFILDESRSTVIFRILQELLTNIARHAGASRVDVNLEKVAGNIVLKVSDNGRGISQEQVNSKKSFGLIGIQEKAKFIGGQVNFNGIIGFGTTVTITVPVVQKEAS